MSRALGANFGMACPPVNWDCTVRELPDRKARPGDYHDWRQGVHPGGDASGALSQRIQRLSSNPPWVRKTAVREAIEVLRLRGQVGVFLGVVADALL